MFSLQRKKGKQSNSKITTKNHHRQSHHQQTTTTTACRCAPRVWVNTRSHTRNVIITSSFPNYFQPTWNYLNHLLFCSPGGVRPVCVCVLERKVFSVSCGNNDTKKVIRTYVHPHNMHILNQQPLCWKKKSLRVLIFFLHLQIHDHSFYIVTYYTIK